MTRWIKAKKHFEAIEEEEKDNLNSDDYLAWAAYHALKQPPIEDPPAIYMCITSSIL